MLTTAALIIGIHLNPLSYLLNLIKPKLLTTLILDANITTVTYLVNKPTVFNNYHLRKKSTNTVMKFWEWIKYNLKIDKELVQIMKTRPKWKKSRRSNKNTTRGTTYK